MAMLESKGKLKDKKTRTEAKMTKRRTTERLLVHRCEDPLCNSEPVDQSLKGFGYVAAKQPSSLHSEVPFPKRELT